MGEDENKLEDLLSMLAIATVCDVVDLTGENRIFVKEGLKRIKETRNVGLRALLDVHDLMENRYSLMLLALLLDHALMQVAGWNLQKSIESVPGRR